MGGFSPKNLYMSWSIVLIGVMSHFNVVVSLKLLTSLGNNGFKLMFWKICGIGYIADLIKELIKLMVFIVFYNYLNFALFCMFGIAFIK